VCWLCKLSETCRFGKRDGLLGANVCQFSERHDEWLIMEKVSQLRQLMSDQNLQLLPDYEQRITVLKDLDFIDQQSRVQLKGKVACEVSLRFAQAWPLRLVTLTRAT
jgi:hypothetical protein